MQQTYKFLFVGDVMEILGISKSKAYEIIRDEQGARGRRVRNHRGPCSAPEILREVLLRRRHHRQEAREEEAPCIGPKAARSSDGSRSSASAYAQTYALFPASRRSSSSAALLPASRSSCSTSSPPEPVYPAAKCSSRFTSSHSRTSDGSCEHGATPRNRDGKSRERRPINAQLLLSSLRMCP